MAPKQSFLQAFAMVAWTLLVCLAWPHSTVASRCSARGARCALLGYMPYALPSQISNYLGVTPCLLVVQDATADYI